MDAQPGHLGEWQHSLLPSTPVINSQWPVRRQVMQNLPQIHFISEVCVSLGPGPLASMIAQSKYISFCYLQVAFSLQKNCIDSPKGLFKRPQCNLL